MLFRTLSLHELVIDDEASFADVPLYPLLRAALRHSGHQFRVPEAGERTSWDRALFLNLTFWSAAAESSVLCDEHITPDVVAHTAWHHLASQALTRTGPSGCAASGPGLLFGEAIASAFDLYLVGRLLKRAPDSEFVSSQLPVMAEAAEQAGLSGRSFEALLTTVTAEPERAFEDMRALLFEAAMTLLGCRDADGAQRVLEGFVGHRFEPLLHHFELSNWILHTRAYAGEPRPDHAQAVRALDETLRAVPDSLTWLAEHWLADARM